jgi:acyl-CoA synthetase (NDP forming)
MSVHPHPLEPLFSPRKVAIIGVSSATNTPCTAVLVNLRRFRFSGKVFGVGAKSGKLHGIPIFPSVDAIPDTIDAAIIAVPLSQAPAALEAAAQKGAHSALVLGDSTGPEVTEELLFTLRELAKRHKLQLLGPGRCGILNTENGLCAVASLLSPFLLAKGQNSMIAEDLRVGLWCASLFSRERQGFNKIVTVGQHCLVDEVEFLDYFREDTSTGAVFLYLERFRRGRELLEAAKRLTKPVVLLKANRFSEGGVAPEHSSYLLADDQVVSAAARQAGMLRVQTLEEMLVAAKAFMLSPCEGESLVALCSPTGFTSLALDSAQAWGFKLPPLPDSIMAKGRGKGAPLSHTSNPIDFAEGPDPKTVLLIAREAINQKGVAGLVVNLAWPGGLGDDDIPGKAPWDLACSLKELSVESGKPIALSLCVPPGEAPPSELAGFPLFHSLEEGVRALAMQRDYWRQKRLLASSR